MEMSTDNYFLMEVFDSKDIKESADLSGHLCLTHIKRLKQKQYEQQISSYSIQNVDIAAKRMYM